MATKKAYKNPTKPKPDASTAKEAQAKAALEAKNKLVEQDKKAVQELVDFSNQNTTLENAAKFVKPIALLDYYTPYIKVKIFHLQTLPGFTNEQETSLFETETRNDNNSVSSQNNYIESFSYEGGTGKQDFILKIIDSNLDFSDTLLMRFAKEFDAGIYLNINYGWSNKEDKANVKIDGITKTVFFTNSFLGFFKDMEVEEDAGKRTITITGHLFNALPGKLNSITPYSEMGPYPMMTYQLLRFLALDEDEMFSILKTASTYTSQSDPGAKVKLKKKEDIKNSITGGNDKKYRDAIKNFTKAEESLSINDPRKKLLESILNDVDNGTDATGQINNIQKFYTNKDFKLLLQGDDPFSQAAEKLVRLFSTILRDIRIHPWVAFKYIIQIMHQRMKEAGMANETFVINDFASIIDPNSFNSNLSFDLKTIENTLVGWDSSMETDTIAEQYANNDKNDTLRVIGILPTDIAIANGNDWGTVLNQCAAKCSIFAKKNFDLDKETGDIKLDAAGQPKKLTQAELQKLAGKSLEDNLKAGIFKNLTGQFTKIEPLKVQCFTTSKQNVLDIFTGQILLNKAKTKQSALSASEFDNTETGSKAQASQIAAANKIIQKYYDKIKNQDDEKNSNGYFLVNIYNNKQTELFDNNFATQNIYQAYSYRFSTQNEYAFNFNPGLPKLKMINFPDVINFKPDLKGIFGWLNNVVSASKNLKINIPADKTSTIRIVSSEEKDLEIKKSQIEEELTTIKNDKKTASSKEGREKVKDLQQQLLDADKFQTTKINNDNIAQRYKNPIYLNMKVPLSFIYGNGRSNNDIGIIKNNIVNFRKRFLTQSANYPATLEIFGDPSFNEIINFGTALIFIKAYNPDGSDSMHTGIYRLQGFKHDIGPGNYKTTLTLMKENKHENPNFKKDLRDIIYADSITTREMWDAINQTDDIIAAKTALRKKLKAQGLTDEAIELQLRSTTIMANTIKDLDTDENFNKKSEAQSGAGASSTATSASPEMKKTVLLKRQQENAKIVSDLEAKAFTKKLTPSESAKLLGF